MKIFLHAIVNLLLAMAVTAALCTLLALAMAKSAHSEELSVTQARAKVHIEAMRDLMTGGEDVATVGTCILAVASAVERNGQWNARFSKRDCTSIMLMLTRLYAMMLDDGEQLRAEAKGAK
jgi:hypothetical protein